MLHSTGKPKKKAKRKTRVLGAKTTVGRGNKQKKSKPLTQVQRKIREDKWNPTTAAAYGVNSPQKAEKQSPQKSRGRSRRRTGMRTAKSHYY